VASGNWQDVVAKRTPDGTDETLGDIAAGFDNITVTVDPGAMPTQPPSAAPSSPEPQCASPQTRDVLDSSPSAAAQQGATGTTGGVQPLREQPKEELVPAENGTVGPAGSVQDDKPRPGVLEGYGLGSAHAGDPSDQPAGEGVSTAGVLETGTGADPLREGTVMRVANTSPQSKRVARGGSKEEGSGPSSSPENPEPAESDRLGYGAGEASAEMTRETEGTGSGAEDQGSPAPSGRFPSVPHGVDDEQYLGYGSGAKELVLDGGKFRVRTSAELDMTARPLRPAPEAGDTSATEGQRQSGGDRSASQGQPLWAGDTSASKAQTLSDGVAASADNNTIARDVFGGARKDTSGGIPSVVGEGEEQTADSVGRRAGVGSAWDGDLESGGVAEGRWSGVLGGYTERQGMEDRAPPYVEEGVHPSEEEEEPVPALPKEVMERVKQESLAFMTQVGMRTRRKCVIDVGGAWVRTHLDTAGTYIAGLCSVQEWGGMGPLTSRVATHTHTLCAGLTPPQDRVCAQGFQHAVMHMQLPTIPHVLWILPGGKQRSTDAG
jgi:hypothetical protein